MGKRRNNLIFRLHYSINVFLRFTFTTGFDNLYAMGRKKRAGERKKIQSGNILLLKTLAVLGLILYVLVIFNKVIDLASPKNSRDKLIASKFLGKLWLTPPPSSAPTPFPTVTPMPSPVPLIGYCLNVPVLMYHHIQPQKEAWKEKQEALSVDSAEFDHQMNYLASSGYSTISTKQLVDALLNHAALPQKSIVITIDDGYEDVYTYAYPILKQYSLIANLAVITGLAGESDYVSWNQIEEMSKSGLVYMTNHTWSHHSIDQGTDGKIIFEVVTAKQQLQDHTGQNIDTFIYPFGAVSFGAIEILRQEGVRGAFSEIPGHWQCDSFIMSLHRTRIGNSPLSYYGL